MKNRPIVNRTYNTRSGKKEVHNSRSQRDSKYDNGSKGENAANSALSKHQEWSSSKDSDKQSEEVVSDYEDELTQEESEDSVDVNLASERTSRQQRRTSRQQRPVRNRSRTTKQSEDSGNENLAAQLTSKKLSPVRNQSQTTELEDSAESSHIPRHIPVHDVSVQPLQTERTKTNNLEDSSARQSENAKVRQDVSVQPLQTERTKTNNLEDSSARQSENAKVRQRILDKHILRQSKITMAPDDYSSYLRDVSNSPLHADGRKQQFVDKMNEMVSGKVGSFREELRKEVENLINSKSSALEKSMAKSFEQAFLEFQLKLD